MRAVAASSALSSSVLPKCSSPNINPRLRGSAPAHISRLSHFRSAIIGELAQRPVCLFLQRIRKFWISLLAFKEWSQGCSDFFAKCDGKRRSCDDIGSIIDKKLNNSRFPAEEHVGEWNSSDLGTARNQQFHQIQPFLTNRICQALIFRFLCLVRRNQF